MINDADDQTLHYTEVLSMSDGRLVAYNGVEGVYKVADALVGPGVTTIALTFVSDACKKLIFNKYPSLADPRVKTAIDTALSEFKSMSENIVRHGLQTQEQQNADLKILLACMDKYVLPLMPEEHMTLSHAGKEIVAEIQSTGGKDGKGYYSYIKNILPSKTITVDS